jgi:hypothetical protein
VGDHTALGSSAVIARSVVITNGTVSIPSLIDGIVGP